MDGEKIYMFNALWLKKDGGEERYKAYLKAVAAVIDKLEIGARKMQSLYPQEVLIGDWDPDFFFLVEYPSRRAFDRMINSEEFKSIAGLREQAIEKSVLLQCKSFP